MLPIQPPDPGFVRPVEMPPPPMSVPTVQSTVAVQPTDDTQGSKNDVKFQDPNRDGRRSLYQEMGGKYVGFFRIRDLNVHKPLTMELDFGLPSARHDFVVAMEAFLDAGISGIHHGLSLTAQMPADDKGRVVATFPPLAKVLADPHGVAGFHVYAFPLGQSRSARPEPSAAAPSRPAAKGLNTRRRPGLGDRFDGSA